MTDSMLEPAHKHSQSVFPIEMPICSFQVAHQITVNPLINSQMGLWSGEPAVNHEMSLIVLWTTVLKPQVWHYSGRHLGFFEPEVTIFGQRVEPRSNPDWIGLRNQGQALVACQLQGSHTLKHPLLYGPSGKPPWCHPLVYGIPIWSFEFGIMAVTTLFFWSKMSPYLEEKVGEYPDWIRLRNRGHTLSIRR